MYNPWGEGRMSTSTMQEVDRTWERGSSASTITSYMEISQESRQQEEANRDTATNKG